MDAIHVNWSAPLISKGVQKYELEDFEILTTILSALNWKKNGGSIKLYADKTAIDYYKQIGIYDIWDTIEELSVPDSVDPDVFWAAGKLFALSNEEAPIAIIDTDFIVWDVSYINKIKDCAVIHFENLAEDIYPPKDYFKMSDRYIWQGFNWNLCAANTAFVIFKNKRLLKAYTRYAIEFMQNAKKTDDYLRYMTFCEQRMLPMVADLVGADIIELMHYDALFGDENKSFTHIWGMKQKMRNDEKLRDDFCKRCVKRIITDFHYMESRLLNIEKIKKYM